jgi:hypothetical protein
VFFGFSRRNKPDDELLNTWTGMAFAGLIGTAMLFMLYVLVFGLPTLP